MKLRPYQQDIYNKIIESYKKGNKSMCVVLGCGGGKSVIIGNLIKNTTDKGNRVLFLVHRKELVEQITNTLKVCNVNMDLCEVGMMQTVTKNLHKTTEPKIIVVDEVHHILSRSYRDILEYFSKSLVVGFTATPTRLGTGGLGEVFDDLIQGVSTQWLIENNYLAPYKYYSVKLADTKELKIIGGDYSKKQVNELMEDNVIYGDTYTNWIKLAKNKKTIIYCSSVISSTETVKEFLNNGVAAVHIDAKTPSTERKLLVDKFRSGEIIVLSNVDLFGEGFDVPDCECVILLRPTKSLTVFIQQSMRSMRYKENKTAIIIDHVRNIFEHGFPDDDRIWSLKSKDKKKNVVLVRECSKCFMVCDAKQTICPYCNYKFNSNTEGKTREIQKVEIELQELKRQDLIKSKNYDDYRFFKTFSEMKEFQAARKYKFAWCLRKCEELNIPIPSKYDYMRRFMK